MDPLAELDDVSVVEGGATVLSRVSWTIRAGEHWAVLGPNGSGKTTLLRVVAGYRLPTHGSVRVLGRTFGRTDLRDLRRLVGFTSAALHELQHAGSSVLDAVAAGKHAAMARFRHDRYEDGDFRRARGLLEAMGIAELERRPLRTLSQGERQRVAIARALMPRPRLLLLDEPAAGLDIGGREVLLHRLSALMRGVADTAVVLVTHHVEELVPGLTHALLLRGGAAVAAGPLAQCLDSERVSRAFGVPLELARRGDRYTATWAGPPAGLPSSLP